jgi:acetyl-CoA synthetase
MKESVDEAANLVPSLQHIIVLKRTELDTSMLPGRDHWWHEIVSVQAETAATEVTPQKIF